MEKVFNKTMNRIIGLLTAWGAESWIRPALKQALEYCDEVMVVVAPHSPRLRKFEDNTYNICKECRGIRLLDFISSSKYVSDTKAEALTYMLKNSELHVPGNWLWILDVDEFYTESAFRAIKVAIGSNEYDYMRVEEKLFLVNMQHYLEGSHGRLIKIVNVEDRFLITNQWTRKPEKLFILPRETGMFHYSMLVDTNMRLAWWKVNFSNTVHPRRSRWLNEIYLKYDLENEDYWLAKNLELSGIKSPWFNVGFSPDGAGRLFSYAGRHPKFIEETDLPKVADFRNYYKKKES